MVEAKSIAGRHRAVAADTSRSGLPPVAAVLLALGGLAVVLVVALRALG